MYPTCEPPEVSKYSNTMQNKRMLSLRATAR